MAMSEPNEALRAEISVDAKTAGVVPERTPELRPDQALPDDVMIVLPVRNMVLFPTMVVPLAVAGSLRRRSAGGGEAGAAARRPVAAGSGGRRARS